MASTCRLDKNRWLMIPLLSTLIILGILGCADMKAALTVEERPSQLLYNVGYKVLDFKFRKKNQKETLTVAVWYPTAAEPKLHNYGGSTAGRVAVDAALLSEKGPYPLLVFSHGYGGSGLGAVFFTERLAAHGWIVAAPDHRDRYSAVRIRTGQLKEFNRQGLWKHAKELATSGPGNREKYLYRLDEMKLVIDRMVASEKFSKVIDGNRIAVGGHSLGGYTVLGLCGTIKKRKDSRIKAVLLFSTGAGGYLFKASELATVRVPSMLFLGEREEKQLRGSETMAAIADKIYRNLPAPKYFLEIKGAGHFSFNNRFSDTRRAKLLSGNEQQFDVIRRYSIAFLEKYVAGKKHGAKILEHSDPMLVRFIKETSLEPSNETKRSTEHSH